MGKQDVIPLLQKNFKISRSESNKEKREEDKYKTLPRGLEDDLSEWTHYIPWLEDTISWDQFSSNKHKLQNKPNQSSQK